MNKFKSKRVLHLGGILTRVRVFSLVLVAMVLIAGAMNTACVADAVKPYKSQHASQEHVSVVSALDQKNLAQFYVELATDSVSQAKGLMNRRQLAENAGMLFLFETTQKRAFWMKDTLIPLDIIFIEPDGRIAHIHHRATPQSLALISSVNPVRAVLEVNGGLADRYGIKVGDKILHPFFRNVLAK